MGSTGRPGGRYIQPIDSNGAPVAADTTGDASHGVYKLTSGNTYYYISSVANASFKSLTITGYDAALAFTGRIQDTNHGALDVTDQSSTVGEWSSEMPSSAYVAADGTGWSQTTGEVTALGTGIGGATWHIAETGAARMRLRVVCTGTGHARVSEHGKE